MHFWVGAVDSPQLGKCLSLQGYWPQSPLRQAPFQLFHPFQPFPGPDLLLIPTFGGPTTDQGWFFSECLHIYQTHLHPFRSSCWCFASLHQFPIAASYPGRAYHCFSTDRYIQCLRPNPSGYSLRWQAISVAHLPPLRLFLFHLPSQESFPIFSFSYHSRLLSLFCQGPLQELDSLSFRFVHQVDPPFFTSSRSYRLSSSIMHFNNQISVTVLAALAAMGVSAQDNLKRDGYYGAPPAASSSASSSSVPVLPTSASVPPSSSPAGPPSYSTPSNVGPIGATSSTATSLTTPVWKLDMHYVKNHGPR